MHKGYLKIAALFGGLAVVLGAFAAHGLKKKLAADQLDIVNVFQTGVQYQMYHALALLAVGILFDKFPNSLLKWAANCFIAGIILFSGSLYLLTFFKVYAANVPAFVGPITPFGGLFFIIGWVLLFLTVAKGRK
jgi:uncharacterized membrane protein YgdD (TMEM256/DUF423 family)